MENRILIIEDNPPIAELLEMNLMVAGYRVGLCADGEEALSLLAADRDFDLALVDIMLPGKDGFELLPYIRERGLPVIFLTAKDDVTSKVRGF